MKKINWQSIALFLLGILIGIYIERYYSSSPNAMADKMIKINKTYMAKMKQGMIPGVDYLNAPQLAIVINLR